MKKIQSHEKLSVIQKPKVGAIEGAHTAVIPYNKNAKPRFSGGNVSARIACTIGCRPPPPAPCKIRKKRRRPRLGAIPQSNELTVKIARQVMKKRLRPKMVTSQPLIGSTMALATR